MTLQEIGLYHYLANAVVHSLGTLRLIAFDHLFRIEPNADDKSFLSLHDYGTASVLSLKLRHLHGGLVFF